MANRYKKAGKPRRKTGRHGKLLAFKAAFTLIMLLAVVYAVAWTSVRAWHRTASLSVFRISGVEVAGLKHVREDDLVSYVGDMRGKSIFRADLARLVEKLQAHPWIKGASVKRELPDGITMSLVEREPAAVALAGRSRYLVDTEGVVLAAVKKDGWDYLPGIVCDSQSQPGRTGVDPAEGMPDALELIRTVQNEPTEVLAGAVVHLGRDRVPYLVMNGAKIEVGREDYEDKVRKLAEIFNDVLKRGVTPERIDLRFPGKVIVDGGPVRRS